MVEAKTNLIHIAFESVEDPRNKLHVSHDLLDVLFIASSTVMANGEDYVDMAMFGRQHLDWLRRYVPLRNGVPSASCFRRTLELLDPEQLKRCLSEQFLQAIGGLMQQSPERFVAVDGKKVRGQSPKSRGTKGLFLLHAVVHDNGICIGQKAVDGKSNEITALVPLLKELNLEATTVTTDAMGCQTEVVDYIRSQQADYLLALKDNQGNLSEQTRESFRHCVVEQRHQEEWTKQHGRIERRVCELLPLSQALISEVVREQWKDLATLIHVRSYREENGKVEEKSRYYISSHQEKSAAWFNRHIRTHWSIENGLHWHLDVSFNEDAAKVRGRQASENLSILRKFCLNLAKIKKRELNLQFSIQKIRYRASLSTDFLTQLFQQ